MESPEIDIAGAPASVKGTEDATDLTQAAPEAGAAKVAAADFNSVEVMTPENFNPANAQATDIDESSAKPVVEKVNFFANKASNDATQRRASYKAPETPLSPKPVVEKVNFFANKAIKDAALRRASYRAPQSVAPEILLAEFSVKDKALYHQGHIDVASAGKRTHLKSSKWAPADAAGHSQASKDIKAKRTSINEAFKLVAEDRQYVHVPEPSYDAAAKAAASALVAADARAASAAQEGESAAAGPAAATPAGQTEEEVGEETVAGHAGSDKQTGNSWGAIYDLLERLDKEKKDGDRASGGDFGLQSVGLSADAARVISALADRTSVSRVEECACRAFATGMRGISRSEFVKTATSVMPRPPLGLDLEIKKLYTPGTWEDVYDILDTDKDGTLSWVQLLNFVEINSTEVMLLDKDG